MEDKKHGQAPTAPLASPDPATAARTAPPGHAADDAGEDPDRLAQARARGEQAGAAMAERGFGDDKGTDGF